MVKKLENGHYYKWDGSKRPKYNWTEGMDEILDGEPRKYLVDAYEEQRGRFENCENNNSWYYGDFLNCFKEVPNFKTKIKFVKDLLK